MANANAEFKLKLATTQLTVQEKERLEVIHDREWSSLALFTDFWLNYGWTLHRINQYFKELRKEIGGMIYMRCQ